MPSTKRSSRPPSSAASHANPADPANDAKVAKQTRRVRVRLSTESELEGTVFLGLYEATHAGPQTVGDLLNGEERFIPLKTVKAVCLINIEQIVSVHTPIEDEADELMTLGEARPVALTMLHGALLRGDIYVTLPEGHRRAKDFFNHAPAFFPLFKEKQIVYINRRFVASVQDETHG